MKRMSWTGISNHEGAEKNDNKILIVKYKAKKSWHKLVERMEGNIYKWKDRRIQLECILEDFNLRL